MVSRSSSRQTFHSLCAAWFVLVVGAAAVPYASGQDAGRAGTVVLADWPEPHVREDLSHDLLPFIDSLFVDYRYGVDGERPSLSITLEWIPDGAAVYGGARRDLSELNAEVRMVAIDLSADVVSDGRLVGAFNLVVDSMLAGPVPDAVEVLLPDLTWDNVFVDVPAEEARSIFEQGFELRDPEIERVAFGAFEGNRLLTRGDVGDAGVGEDDVDDGDASRGSRTRHVYVYDRRPDVNVVFDLFWLIGEDGRRSDRTDDTNAGTPRGEMGRGVLGTMIGDRDDDDDDDDDEDDRLVPYAAAAVGAVGLLAFAGGTIGYFGNTRHARYGLTSGLVRDNGGLLLQVGVNESLLTDGDSPKHLVAKLLAFGNLLPGSVQPALGAGVLATGLGSEIETRPSVSIGAVARPRALVLYGGYDVYQKGFEFGLAVNVRELWGSREEE